MADGWFRAIFTNGKLYQLKARWPQIRLFLFIGLSYCIFWTVVMLLSARRTGAEAFSYILAEYWTFAYLTVINLLLHLYGIPFVQGQKRKWLWIPLLVLLFILLLSVGNHLWSLLGRWLFGARLGTYSEQLFSNLVRLFTMGTLASGYFAAIKFYTDAVALKRKNQDLLIEKQASELNFLKTQTNPHFLFNTLNNIYSLARDKSDLAPECILKLSKILRYILYETGGASVCIEQEIRVMEDYIALEKIRYDDSLQVDFVCEVDNPKQSLPPLLLVPLIENAFKHGVSETRDHPFIRILLTVSDNRLLYRVENSVSENAHTEPARESIGLTNLRRQLELLFTRYSFSAVKKEKVFIAELSVNLSGHEANKMYHR
jgi:two-component system, LytTR family, sensor kinase